MTTAAPNASTAAPPAASISSLYAAPAILTPSEAAAAQFVRHYSTRWWEVGALTFPVAGLTTAATYPFLSHVEHRPALNLARVRADPGLPWRGHWGDIRTQTLRLTGLFTAKQYLRAAFDIWGQPSSALEDFSRNFAAGGLAGLMMTLPWYMGELHEKRMTGGSKHAKLPPGTFGRGWNMRSNPASIQLMEFTKRNGWWGHGGAHAGAGLASMRVIVQRGLYFGLYDTLTAPQPDLGYAPRMALAYAVAFGANVAAQPLAEIHERTQYWRGPTRRYASAFEGASKLTATGGPFVLWKGSMSRLARTAVPQAMLLVGVDAIKQLYARLRKRDETVSKVAEAKAAQKHYPIAGTSKAATATPHAATNTTAATAATAAAP